MRGSKYRKKMGTYRPGNRKDRILWHHPDGMTLKGGFDPMGGAKRSERYKGRMSRGRMLKERDEFMLRLGDPTPPPPAAPPAPDPVVEQQVTNSEWMEEYHHWWGDPEEIEWEQFQKGQEMADRLYPDYDQYWDEDEYDRDAIGWYELPWPEFANRCHYDFDDYELDEEERIEWTEWYKETAA